MFTSVEVVLHRYSDAKEIGWHISEFIGLSPSLSLDAACSFGSILFLDWVWTRSTPAQSRSWSLSKCLHSDPLYYRWQFPLALEVAAARGNLSIVKWLFSHFDGCYAPPTVVDIAAKNGHLHVMRFLLAFKPGSDNANTKDANELCQELSTLSLDRATNANVVNWGDQVILKAAEHGHSDIVRWLLGNNVHEVDDDQRVRVIENLLRIGDFELVDLLLPSDGSTCELDYDRLCPEPHVIEWMLDLGYLQKSRRVAASAIRDLSRTGHLELMQQILLLHSPLTAELDVWLDDWSEALINACKRGDLPMTRWLAEHQIGHAELQRYRAPVDDPFCLAAGAGQVAILQYFHDHGLRIRTDEALLHAVRGNCIESVKWLTAHLSSHYSHALKALACQADKDGEQGVVQSIGNNDLSVLPSISSGKRKREQVIEVTASQAQWEEEHYWWLKAKELYRSAARNGHLTILKWLRQFCPLDRYHYGEVPLLKHSFNDAAGNGHLEVAQWLYDKLPGRNTDEAVKSSCRNGRLEVVKWLTTTINRAVATEAAASAGQLEVLKWLQNTYMCTITETHSEDSINNGHLRVASWLCALTPTLTPRDSELFKDSPPTFEMLLFLFGHYPRMFEPEFINRIQCWFKPGLEMDEHYHVRCWLDEMLQVDDSD